ncbi:MAG: hypothetical protein ACR2QE_15295 [Acidimicrobiales bacterium]
MERQTASSEDTVLGPGSTNPPRNERVLAATLVAFFPFALHGRSATSEEVERWDELRSRYLGVDHCHDAQSTGRQ